MRRRLAECQFEAASRLHQRRVPASTAAIEGIDGVTRLEPQHASKIVDLSIIKRHTITARGRVSECVSGD